MRVPASLLALMQVKDLSASLLRRLGPEDAMARAFAHELRAATLEGRLRAVWTHVPNELAGTAGRATVHAAIARVLGLIPGTGDYLFLAADRSLVLEAKSATGSLSPNQRAVRDWCAAQSVPYAVFRTVDAGLAILKERGLLL